MDLSGCGSQAGVLVRITYMNLYNPTLISPVMHWTKVLTPGLYGPRSARSIPSRRIPKGRESFLISRFSLKQIISGCSWVKIGIFVVVNILPGHNY